MNRSVHAALRGRGAAMFHKLVALVTTLSILAPSIAWAGTPYSVLWSSHHDATSCGRPVLENEGTAIFKVNQTPLPTYEVPGALQSHGDGSQSNTREAEFDSVLLLMGANAFHFGVHTTGGGNWCTHAHEVVHLVSEPLGLNKRSSPGVTAHRHSTCISQRCRRSCTQGLV